MNHNRQLQKLLQQWRETRAQGNDITPEDLCRDHPELLAELKKRIDAHDDPTNVSISLDANLDAHSGSQTPFVPYDSISEPKLVDTDAAFVESSEGPAKFDDPDQTSIVKDSATGSTAARGKPPGKTRKTGLPKNTPLIPGYEILGILGRGGAGIVYKAREAKLNRIVALKMLLHGGHAQELEWLRLQSEARTIASLNHPNIVQIHEIGEHDGLPYLSLEFCEGGSLSARIGGEPLPPSEAARIIESLARTMHVVHEKGIVHRDLKPANVLLGSRDEGVRSREDNNPPPAGLPFRAHHKTSRDQVAESERGTASRARSPMPYSLPPTPYSLSLKITDFGLAKRYESSKLTATSSVIGTPSYMAPEQVRRKRHPISPATDVYALGATLYELLTGRAPFKAANSMDTMIMVLGEEPVPPCRLQPNVPRDLEIICLKCLQKDPPRRYQSALGLAEDLDNFLNDRPINARPVGWLERAVKWSRRHPSAAAMIAITLLTVIVSFALVTWQWRLAVQAQRDTEIARQDEAAQRRRALEALARSELDFYISQIALAQREWSGNNIRQAEVFLQRAPPKLRHWEWHYLKRLCHNELRTLPGHDESVLTIAYAPDGNVVASAGEDMIIRLWNAGDHLELHQLKGHNGWVRCLAFHPDGKTIASAGHDAVIYLWDVQSGKKTGELRGHTDVITGLAYSADGNRLISTSRDQSLRCWETATGNMQLSMEQADGFPLCLTVHPKKPLAATGGTDKRIRFWSLADKKEDNWQAHDAAVTSVAFSPDGKHLASAGADDTVKVWNLETKQPIYIDRHHSDIATQVVFHPKRKILASAGLDRTVRIHRLEGEKEVVTFRGHYDTVNDIAFHPINDILASASADKTIKFWRADVHPEFRAIKGHKGAVWGLAFSPDSQSLASAGADHVVRLTDLSGTRGPLALTGHKAVVEALDYSADGKYLASAGKDAGIKIWNPKTGREMMTFSGHEKEITGLAFHPNRPLLASSSRDGTVRLWDLTTKQIRHIFNEHKTGVACVAFSRDGRWLAAAGQDRVVKLWNVKTRKRHADFAGHSKAVNAVAFHPKRPLLATAGDDHAIRIWDIETGKERHELRGHGGIVWSLAFSDDGARLISASADHTIKTWDTSYGKEIHTLRDHSAAVNRALFSSDGRWLASASENGAIHLKDGATAAK